MPTHSLSLLTLAAILISASGVRGQNTTAACLEQYNWMRNSLGQSPCLVTAWLGTPCYTLDKAVVNALDPGRVYSGARANSTANSCICNTVLYSTLSACAVCQGQGLAITPWPVFSQFCTNPAIGKYPEPISGGTRIPAWAYLDVVQNSTFNVDAAQALANQHPPESTGNAPASTTSSTSSNSSATSTAGGGTSTAAQSHSNAGAVAGGVVGAFIAAFLIGAAIMWGVLRRRRSRESAASFEAPIFDASEYGYRRYEPPPSVEQAPLIYNPNDPRTFPAPATAADYDRASTFEAMSRPVYIQRS